MSLLRHICHILSMKFGRPRSSQVCMYSSNLHTCSSVAPDLAWASSKLIRSFNRALASSSFLSLRCCLSSFLMSRLSSSSCFSSPASVCHLLFWHCLYSFCSRCEIFLLVSRPVHGIIEKPLSTHTCWWNSSIGPGIFVHCHPLVTPATVILTLFSNLFFPTPHDASPWHASRPRWSFESWMAVLAFWRKPKTKGIRGALSLNDNATWSSEIQARIISQRDHCSGLLPQTEQEAESTSESPSSHPIMSLVQVPVLFRQTIQN